METHPPVIKSDEENSPELIRIRASSKHLTLASPVFKVMLHANFREGLEFRDKGHAELRLLDDDPDAFLIVLNLIHGHIRKVPREIDLPMLTEIAIIADKYEVLESTEMLFEHWFQNLEETVPVTLNDDLLPWMCISWVFKKPDIFKRLTKIAQLESKGFLDEKLLPIPESILSMDSYHAEPIETDTFTDTIDHYRESTLIAIFTYLKSILDTYENESVCRKAIECDAMTLGILTIRLKVIKVHQPRPPYYGFSIKTFFHDLRQMRMCKYHTCTSNRYYPKPGGVKAALETKLQELEQRIHGLELVDETARIQKQTLQVSLSGNKSVV